MPANACKLDNNRIEIHNKIASPKKIVAATQKLNRVNLTNEKPGMCDTIHQALSWMRLSLHTSHSLANHNSSSPSSFAQRQQRPRSPVPAAAAIHERHEASRGDNFAEVTYVPVATAGPCRTDCQMVMPFMVLLFFMTLLVAVTQVSLRFICVPCKI